LVKIITDIIIVLPNMRFVPSRIQEIRGVSRVHKMEHMPLISTQFLCRLNYLDIGTTFKVSIFIHS